MAATLKITMFGHIDYIRALTILENGDIVSGSVDKSIKIWNINDGSLKRTLNGHTHHILALTSLSNGDLVSGSYRDKNMESN